MNKQGFLAMFLLDAFGYSCSKKIEDIRAKQGDQETPSSVLFVSTDETTEQGTEDFEPLGINKDEIK